MHRKTSRQALGQCKNTTSWGRMIGRDGQNFYPRSQAQNAAQPCLYDVYDPLTGHTKKAGLKTTFSPEIAILSTERLKNSRISQMNSPAQLLEMCSSWHGWVKLHSAHSSFPAFLTQLCGWALWQVVVPDGNAAHSACLTSRLSATESERGNRKYKGEPDSPSFRLLGPKLLSSTESSD